MRRGYVRDRTHPGCVHPVRGIALPVLRILLWLISVLPFYRKGAKLHKEKSRRNSDSPILNF